MVTTPRQFGEALAEHFGLSAPADITAVGDLFESDSLATPVLAAKVLEIVNTMWGRNLLGKAAIFPRAATVDIGTAASHLITITGGGDISSFGEAADVEMPMFYIEAIDGHTVVASADMQTPLGVDLTFDAGANYWARYLGEGAWRILPFGLVEGDTAPGQKLRILRVDAAAWAYTPDHRGWLIEFDAACTVTLPAGDDGENFLWQQNTAGQVSFVKAGGGAPVNVAGFGKSAGQYATGNCWLSDGLGWVLNGATGA